MEHLQEFNSLNGKPSVNKVLNSLPNLQRKLPLSLQFYLKAVNKDMSRDVQKMIKNGIGKDPRVYYRDFLSKLLADNRKIKASEIEKFMTDNILEVKKNQHMNEKCVIFM